MSIFSKITAAEYLLPEKSVKNEDLYTRWPQKKVDAVAKLSGILQRRIADTNQTSVDLGADCAKNMLEKNNIDPTSIDFLLFATATRDYILPTSASIIHNRLALPKHCGAIDLVQSCPAFPYALSYANGLIAAGQCKKILVIVADTLSKLVHPQDKSLVMLHGDGAASFIVEKSDDNTGIEFIELGANSADWQSICVPAGGFRTPRSPETAELKTDGMGNFYTDENLQMNGADVFYFSMSTVPEEIKYALQKHDVSFDDIDLVLLHQANKTMLDGIYKQLKIPEEKQFFFMRDIGNLGAAATPVALAEAVRQNKIKKGMRVLICSFGVGMAWGTALISF